jgi:multidrug resistance efflux pump
MTEGTEVARLQALTGLMGLQRAVQASQDAAEASFLIVNQTASVAPYDQATLMLGPDIGRFKVARVSHVSEVDKTAPQVAWMERLAAWWGQRGTPDQPWAGAPGDLPEDLRSAMAGQVPPCLVLLPLRSGRRACLGLLVLARREPWTAAEMALLDHLAASYGTTLEALQDRPWVDWRSARLRRSAWVGMALLVLAGLIPVRISVLASAEIQPRDPYILTAPLDGVVARVTVAPNQTVRQGQVLALMEATDLKGAQDVSRKALEVAQAELRRAQQTALRDTANAGDLAQLRAQVGLRQQELEFASSRRRNTGLLSARDGVAIVGDADLWKGRPVRVGERILQIADPAQVEVTVMVPVKDAIALEPGRLVRLFLDTAPLSPREAVIEYATYEPVTAPQEAPAYKVTARLTDSEPAPRIGLRGTARVYGEQVSLFYFLFRKPITATRQWMGF